MTNTKQFRIQRLIQSLNDPRRRKTRRAEKQLIAIGNDAVQPSTDAAASIRSKEAKLCITWALGCIGDKRAFDTILRFTSDPDEFVRFEATWALGKLKDERAIEPLISFLDSDDHSGVGGSAGNALAEIGDMPVPHLIEAAKNVLGSKKISLVYALGGINNQSAVLFLSEMLNDTDPKVREAAIEGLGNTGELHPKELGQTCLELISARLNDSDESVRETAQSYVKCITQAIERLSWKRHQPKSHKIRLILSDNSENKKKTNRRLKRMVSSRNSIRRKSE